MTSHGFCTHCGGGHHPIQPCRPVKSGFEKMAEVVRDNPYMRANSREEANQNQRAEVAKAIKNSSPEEKKQFLEWINELISEDDGVNDE